MGLDMYLTGERYFHHRKQSAVAGQPNQKSESYDLGYWRKHPNLHGYIVQEFPAGVDDCREISLSNDYLLQIIEAVKSGELPATAGFFFGESDGSAEEIESDLAILESALTWLNTEDADAWRFVSYRASW